MIERIHPCDERDRSTQNDISVIIYSPSCHSRVVCCYLFCGRKRREERGGWTDLWRGEKGMEEEVNRRVAGRFKVSVCVGAAIG